MKNPKYWRKRSIEEEKRRLEALERKLVFSKIAPFDNEGESKHLSHLRRLAKLLGWNKRMMRALMGRNVDTNRRKRSRLARKIRRMEKGIYRRRK